MKVFSIGILIIASLLTIPPRPKPVVIGYVGGYNGLINISAIDPLKLTHINYAFVDVKDNKAWLHNERTDSTNFRLLNDLKKINPSLQILISIGGWSWSKQFSDAVLTASSRRQFASSAIEIIHNYHLDGIDIDWEYPNMAGDGNKYRPEDRTNYTLMFRELRHQLDSLTLISGKKYLLTTAVGGFQSFIDNTEMDQAQLYLDYINLMTYDYSWNTATHHTNLYAGKNDQQAMSGDRAFREFVKAGVPANKLVMGLAFYGKGGFVKDTTNNGYGQKLISSKAGEGFTYIHDSLVNRNGFLRYWDSVAKAPYLFNASTRQFITYEDEASVAAKCDYVIANDMGGVMFWEYSSDPKLYLLNVVTEKFKAIK